MLRRVASSARGGAVGASTSAARSPAGAVLDAVRRAAAADGSDVSFEVLRRCRERLDALEKACVAAVPDLTLQDRTFVLGAFHRARAGNGQLLGAVLDVVRREVVPHRNTSTRPLPPRERECVTSIVVHAAGLDAHQNNRHRSAAASDERVGAVPRMIALLLQPTPPGTDDADRLLEAVLRWLVLVDCEAAPEKGRALHAEAYRLLRELLVVQHAHFSRALLAAEATARNPEGGHDETGLSITRLCTYLDAYVALCRRDRAQDGSLADALPAETVVDTACRVTAVWLDGVRAGTGGVKPRAALRLVAAVFSKLSAVHDAVPCGAALRSNLLEATTTAHAVAAWWRHAMPYAADELLSRGAPSATADAVASFASAAALLLQRCCGGCDAAPTGDAAAAAAATTGKGEESARLSVLFVDVVAQAAEVIVDALACGDGEGPPLSPHDAGAAVHNARVECVLIECVVAAAAACAAAEGRQGAPAAALRVVSTQLLQQVERRLAGWYLPARAGVVEGCLAFAVEPSAQGGPVGLLSVYLRTLAQGAEALRRDAALRASHVTLSAHIFFTQAKEAADVAARSANDACGFLAFAVSGAEARAQRKGGRVLHPGLAAGEADALLATLLGPPLRRAVAAHAATFASPLRREDQRLRDAFAVAVAFGAALPLPLPHDASGGNEADADEARLSFFGQTEHADTPRAAARRRDPWRAVAEGGVWMAAAEEADAFARGGFVVRRQAAQRRFNVGHRVLRAAQALAAAEVAGAQPAELAGVVPVLGVVALGCEAAEEAVGSADARQASCGDKFSALERSVAWLIKSGGSAPAEHSPERRQNLLVDYGYACTKLDALVERCARLVQADRRVSLPLSQGVQLGAELVVLRRTLTKRNTRAIDAVVYTSLADAAAQLQVKSCRPHASVPVGVRQALWLASVCMSDFARDSKMGHMAVTVFCRARSIVEASCNDDGCVSELTGEAAAVALWCLASHADDFGAPVRLMSELVAQCARDVSQVSHEALLHATLALHSWGLPASQLQGELSRRVASKELQAQRLGARCMLKDTGAPFPWL